MNGIDFMGSVVYLDIFFSDFVKIFEMLEILITVSLKAVF